ncbi:MAG: mechanosensitive ion channel family protein, partial [Rhizobiales bacterium]|nr:mechanosensitive ion channel family protein [Hyphomicrobiales bacterium]
IGNMILGVGAPETKPAALRVFARIWHVPVMVYVVAAFATTTVRLVTSQPNALGLVVAPVLLIFAALAVNGVALLVIEWAFTRRRSHAIAAGAEGLEENLDPASAMHGLQGLAEHAAGLIIIAGTFWLIAAGWGIDIAEPGTVLHNVWEIVLIAFLAYISYEAVKVTIDRKIAEEVGEPAEVELGAEGGGQGASRLGTLLPLFRNFLVVLIFAIAVMIALSELGVDIGPLFAGAGVVGVAIGFGSQTLIRDIFSGAFFLIDDAFRKNEYIEIAGTRGTVEKISVRSMQLRHHMGKLHTIPFGEITQLTNFSRDWVMMKLPLRVPYDTDVEKVRKLIKGLGHELLEHPELGHLFLEPLKSQGVYQMEDSAMIIRVKFMTKPGDQFSIRKVVYARIRELFEENGIRFASREVTVRVADTPASEHLSDEERKAIAGAVRPLLDEENEAAAASEPKR